MPSVEDQIIVIININKKIIIVSEISHVDCNRKLFVLVNTS
jgi:hypothetical protein